MLVLSNTSLKLVLQVLFLGTVLNIALLTLDIANVFEQTSPKLLGIWSSSANVNHTLKLQNSLHDYEDGQVNSTMDKLSKITGNETIQELLPQLNNTTKSSPQQSSLSTINETNVSTDHFTVAPTPTNTTSVASYSTLGATTANTVFNITDATIEKLMTSWTDGRLGNKMGIHAVSLGLAQMNGYKTVMDPGLAAALRLYFDMQTPTMDEETKNKSWTRKLLTDYMQEQYRHWNDPYIRVMTYLNSWTFYHHIRPTILKEFTFKKELRDEAQRILHDILNKLQRNATFIGVHVRRTDYVRILHEGHLGVLADKRYMDEAMAIFRSRYKDAVFIIASDDEVWCQTNINSSLGDVFILGVTNETSPGQDMATLVACNHTIMTVGTFGYWASYLCGGDVIYLTNFTEPNQKQSIIQNYSAFYLPEWYGIAADLSPVLNLTTTQVSTVTTQTKAVT